MKLLEYDRRNNDLTITEVAKRAGIERRRYGCLERGVAFASEAEGRHIGRLFQREAEDYFDESGKARDVVTYLAHLRGVLELSRADFAISVEMGTERFSQLELCNVLATPAERERIARALSVEKVDDLFDIAGRAVLHEAILSARAAEAAERRSVA